MSFLVNCPHCNDLIIIEEINCGIFRHAWYKINHQQINPHLSKTECDELIKNNSIYGCCKPFKIINNRAIECDYI